MKVHRLLLIASIATFLIVACQQAVDTGQPNTPETSMTSDEDKLKYPDFGFMLPSSEYHGRVFKLSADFPKKMPTKDAALKAILAINFKTDWDKYLNAVKAYVFEGNANKDYENGFFLEDNTKRAWFHVPWQHWGPTGREGFHGLTQEGPIGVKTLAQTQTSATHAYAVGFYNDLGGYTIGKVWNGAVPDYTSLNSEGFPEGTVVAKLLYVPLKGDQVPYLANPVTWNAYIYKSDVTGNKADSMRIQHPVNLLQMDIMVKDPAAKETGGWVFGTFVYNGALGNDNKWENLMPVGIQWGNDPEDKESNYNPTPTATVINANLKETIINPSADLPPMHLGWNSRLNGPADNAYSSCMSCHSTAEYPVISNILPQFNTPPVPIPAQGTQASATWMRWFRNVPCGDPFDKQATSFDYSLQLVKSIQNYIEFASAQQKGIYHEDYWSRGNRIRRNKLQQ